MKKLIALILCALLMFSAIAPSAFALGDEPEAGGEPFDVTVPDEAGSVEPEGEPVPTEGEPAAAIVRTARGVARSYAAWLVSAANPDKAKDYLGLKPAQITALETIADGTFDLTNKTYANN